MTKNITGMNINEYLEQYGFRGSKGHLKFEKTHFVVYTKSSGKIVYFGTDRDKAMAKYGPGKGILIPGGQKVKLGKERDPRLAFPSGFGL